MAFQQCTMPIIRHAEKNDARGTTMNNNYRKPLQNTQLEYFDVRQAVENIQPGAYAKLPYTSKVLAEQLVRRCDPAILEQSLNELIERVKSTIFLGIQHVWCVMTFSDKRH